MNPRGFAINCTKVVEGSVADIQVFRHNLEFHYRMHVKTGQDLELEDCVPMNAQLTQEWATLARKGYQGLAQQLRAIHLKRAPPGRRLLADEERENDKISIDGVIVENCFGRLSTLWRICADKYRWGHDLYDDIFQACVSLTNLHIAANPLRDTDGEEFNRVQNRLIAIGTLTGRRRRLTRES